MKVIIYRVNADAKDACAGVQLGVPKWAIEEFLAVAGLDRGFDEEPAPWRDPEEPRTNWQAIALTESEAVGLPGERIESDNPTYADHALGTVVVSFPSWAAEETLSTLLGSGWWRFLSPHGEQVLLDGWNGGGDVKAPTLVLSHKAKRFLITDEAGNLRIVRGVRDAQFQLLDSATFRMMTGAVFTQDTPIDQVVCELLQRFSQFLNVVGIAVCRRPAPAEAGEQPEPPQFRLAVLFMDTEPDPDAEPPDLGGGGNI